jgi:hypothetical protein
MKVKRPVCFASSSLLNRFSIAIKSRAKRVVKANITCFVFLVVVLTEANYDDLLFAALI